MMKRTSLYFIGSEEIEVRDEDLSSPKKDEVLVENEISSISAGSELLFYRGQVEEGIPIDEKIENLTGDIDYPLKYGYSSVGRVKELGEEVPSKWEKRRVFSFHPHESYFLAPPKNLIPAPEHLTSKEISFLPSLETAINLIIDGRPIIGENAIVLGQGVIGLLVTFLLKAMAVKSIVTSDRHPMRREKSENMGADFSLEADMSPERFLEKTNLPDLGADLSYEVSGNPVALERAIKLTRYDGRVIVGSWYGAKNRGVNLGTNFHRKRVDLISSQVGSINPEISGRWCKSRRMNLAWNIMEDLNLESLITHEFSLDGAERAYSLLNNHQEKTLQVIFNY